MIVNAYAVLAAFVSFLQFAIGLLVISSSFGRRRVTPALSAFDAENRPYLLLLLSFLLLGLNLASWPLLYALLQSYVPSWPDVMCIYGVTRIGAAAWAAHATFPGCWRRCSAPSRCWCSWVAAGSCCTWPIGPQQPLR